jgi:hypothetical protein
MTLLTEIINLSNTKSLEKGVPKYLRVEKNQFITSESIKRWFKPKDIKIDKVEDSINVRIVYEHNVSKEQIDITWIKLGEKEKELVVGMTKKDFLNYLSGFSRSKPHECETFNKDEEWEVTYLWKCERK